MTLEKSTGSPFEISIDGVARTHHDVRATAIEIGKNLKDANRQADVKVRDLRDGSIVAAIGWENGKTFVKK